jgi:hypothetical protein
MRPNVPLFGYLTPPSFRGTITQVTEIRLREGLYRMDTQYLTPQEAASSIPGMTVTLLAQLRFRGMGPVFLKPTPRKVIYRKSDLDKWLADSARVTTAEAS